MSQKSSGMLSSPIHTILFFGFAIYAWYAMGDDIVFLWKMGSLYVDAFLTDPVGTIKFFMDGGGQ